MDAQWSVIGRPVKMRTLCINLSDTSAFLVPLVPPLADQWRPLSDQCGDHCASIQRPRQHLSHHGNGSAFTLPSLRDLLCHYSSFGRSRKAQGSCCSSYTETEISGFRRPLSVLTIFMVAQRWHEGRSTVLRGLYRSRFNFSVKNMENMLSCNAIHLSASSTLDVATSSLVIKVGHGGPMSHTKDTKDTWRGQLYCS